MMRNILAVSILFLVQACTGDSGAPQPPTGTDNAVDPVMAGVQPVGFASQLGTVKFPVSCNEDAAAMVERGVALLHHMSYIEANSTFERAATADADCAMAYWGTAMTYIHPLWADLPSTEQLVHGQELVEIARSKGDKSSRESAYIDTLEAYYRDAAEKGEQQRLAEFDRAWEALYRSYPDDLEAAAFYALMHLAPARFEKHNDLYINQKESAAIVESVLSQVPDHPGAHHYIIHANDYPELAERALAVSYNYGEIAPDVPHALHMPSHIFTRRGMWNESVALNTRASAAAMRQSDEIEAIVVHYPHALDYLVYAQLQVADDDGALHIRDTLLALKTTFHPVNIGASGFAISAIPARVALERRDWTAAAQLALHQPASFPWGPQHAAFESLVHYARAIGGARSGNLDVTRASLAELERMGAWIKENLADPYWFSQADVQTLVARAWLDYAERRTEEALQGMRKASDIENSTIKAGVTPGEVLPASEMLGDMLVELGRYSEALESYRTVLENSPNRFNSLFGAGYAAELSGDTETAASYYQQLVDMAGSDRGRRDRLDQALTFLAADDPTHQPASGLALGQPSSGG